MTPCLLDLDLPLANASSSTPLFSSHDDFQLAVQLLKPSNTASSFSRLISPILQLPKEIFQHIVSYVTSKQDLSQLCLVHSKFQSAVLPALYKTLDITLEDELDPCLVQMIAPENTSLSHVKNIIVSTTHSINTNPQAIHQWLRILITRIEKNSLVDFRWITPHPLPHDILSQLWSRQRNLRRLEVFAPFIRDSWTREEELDDVNLLDEFGDLTSPNLKEVRVVPDSSRAAFVACAALKRDKVTCLDVDGCLWSDGDARIVDGDDASMDDDEAMVVEDSLTRCLFSHVKMVQPGRTPNCDTLRDLRLKDINLTLCKHTWFCLLELSKLENLRIEYCTGADIFLLKLADGAATPSLHRFTLVHDLGKRPDRTIHAIEELLNFPRNKLRHLELSLRNAQQLPSVQCIRAHGKTLQTLLLDIQTNDTDRNASPNGGWNRSRSPPARKHSNVLAYDKSDFESLIQSLSAESLLELAIGFPDYGHNYKHFTSHGSEFADYIETISKGLQLATLSVLTWPFDYVENASAVGMRTAKNLQLARVASDIFRLHKKGLKSSGHRVLEVVAFGTRELDTKTHPPPVYFVPSKVHVVGKTPKAWAQEVDLGFLKDHGMETRTLDYDVRDWEETSRKNFGTQQGWDNVSDRGSNFGGW